MNWRAFVGGEIVWGASLFVSAAIDADKTISFINASFLGLLWAICYLARERDAS
jgi:hypothetical protein